MTEALISLFMFLSLSIASSGDQGGSELFPAISEGKTGYINREGELVIPHLFEDGREFSQGLAAVLVDGRWGYVNTKGEITIRPVYQEVGTFSDGLAWVRINGKCGYINQQGVLVIEPQYKRAASFSEGFAVAEIDWRRDVLLDHTGKVIIGPDRYRMMYEPTAILSGFSEGLLLAYPRGKRFPVYLDRDGKIAVRVPLEGRNGTYTRGTAFSDGLAAVRIGKNWGYIDKRGIIVIPPQYAKAVPFRQGHACVEVHRVIDHVGRVTRFLMNSSGVRVKKIPWVTSGGFSEGLVPIGSWQKEERRSVYGYMNTRGEVAIQPEFDGALPFQNGLGRVKYKDRDAYVDKQGRHVWVGKAKGQTPITSYSSKSMLKIYNEMLRQEDWTLAYFYIQKMSRKELVEGSRMTLKWLLQDPKRLESRDIGRRGVIGMTAIAPFLETYSRSFLSDQKPIDPSPFRSMLLDKSLDIDFRRQLAVCYADRDFYSPSWQQIAEDVEVLSTLVCDATEDDKIRRDATRGGMSLIRTLYWNYCRETVQEIASSVSTKGPPDIGAMIAASPTRFTSEQREHWEVLVNSAEKLIAAALNSPEDAQDKRVWQTACACSKQMADYHLLRDKELLEKVRELTAKKEKANTRDH